jgi:hypothetical protein
MNHHFILNRGLCLLLYTPAGSIVHHVSGRAGFLFLAFVAAAAFLTL